MGVRSFPVIISTVIVALSLLVGTAPAGAAGGDPVPPEPPAPTLSDYYPEQRSLSECLGALQRPNCGSEERGGWRQLSILGAVVAGLGFIGWRIARSMRKPEPDVPEPTAGTVTGRDP